MAEAQDRAALSSGSHCISTAHGGGVTKQRKREWERLFLVEGSLILAPNLLRSKMEALMGSRF